MRTVFDGLNALLLRRMRRIPAEWALRESEDRFRLMADAAPVLVWMSGPDMLCDYFNRPWLEFTGRTIEQELGNGWAEGIWPDDLDHCLRTYVSAFEARRPFRMEYRLRRADGLYRWVLDNGVPRYGPNGTFAGYIGSCIDITDRKELEDALREHQQRYTLASAAAAAGVWDWNLETNDIYVDPQLKRILGFEDAEIGNHLDDWRARVHPEDAERMMAEALSSTNCGSDGYELEQRMLHKDGSLRWFLTRGSVMRRVDGTPHRVVGSSVDITERKRSAERFRIALEAAPAGMFMVDRTGKIALVNSQVEKLFGYAREELINMPVEMLVPERFRGQHSVCRAGFSGDPSAWAMGGSGDLCGLRKDGTEVPIEIGLNPIQTPEGEFVLGAITDITERKQAEQMQEHLTGRLQRMAGRLIAAQEDERRRIARELHDNLNQRLALLAIEIQQVTLQLPEGTVGERMRDIWAHTTEISKEVHNLSHQLHSTTLDALGLVAAIRTLSRELSEKGFCVTFVADEDFRDVSPETELALFRIVQEALTNTFRHSGTHDATVMLRRSERAVLLRVEDRGCGFERQPHREGLGMLSMRERLVPLGGRLQIRSQPGEGTVVEAQVPRGTAQDVPLQAALEESSMLLVPTYAA